MEVLVDTDLMETVEMEHKDHEKTNLVMVDSLLVVVEAVKEDMEVPQMVAVVEMEEMVSVLSNT